MYFEDEMTPKERMTAFSKGEPMDQITCSARYGGNYGMVYR